MTVKNNNVATKVTLAILGQKLDDLILRLDQHAATDEKLFAAIWEKTNLLMDTRSRIYGALAVISLVLAGVGATVIKMLVR